MAYNVLIVDDSSIVRSVISKMLGLCGLQIGEIHESGNGKDALEVVENEWIDVIIADINMPVMNGIEFVNHLKEKGQLETTPVIIVSTERSQTRIEDLKAKGISAYLSKPFTPESIKATVETIFASKNQDPTKRE